MIALMISLVTLFVVGYITTGLIRLMFNKTFWWWFPKRNRNQNGNQNNTGSSFSLKKFGKWFLYVVGAIALIAGCYYAYDYYSSGSLQSVHLPKLPWVSILVLIVGVVLLIWTKHFIRLLGGLFVLIALIVFTVFFWKYLVQDNALEIRGVPRPVESTVFAKNHTAKVYREDSILIMAGGEYSIYPEAGNDVWVIPSDWVYLVYPSCAPGEYVTRVNNAGTEYDFSGNYNASDVGRAVARRKPYKIKNSLDKTQKVYIRIGHN